MRVDVLGTGAPEVAIVGGVHGDEPCGVRAIDRLLADPPAVERPVALIVANEAALERGVRYIEADLNRAFGDDVDPAAHEYRIAEALADAIRGCPTLSIHSTQSHAEPFALVNGIDDPAMGLCSRLSIDAVVDVDADEGRLFAIENDLIEVEAGRQGTPGAVANAERIAREFLVTTGAVTGRTEARDHPVFRLQSRVEKPPASTYEVFVENFTRVDRGETYAAADGEALVADDPFVPILFSADGYAGQFGYAGESVDSPG